jgi:hypothetical protein
VLRYEPGFCAKNYSGSSFADVPLPFEPLSRKPAESLAEVNRAPEAGIAVRSSAAQTAPRGGAVCFHV